MIGYIDRSLCIPGRYMYKHRLVSIFTVPAILPLSRHVWEKCFSCWAVCTGNGNDMIKPTLLKAEQINYWLILMYCIRMNCDIKTIQGTRNLIDKQVRWNSTHLFELIVDLPNSSGLEISIKSTLTFFIVPDKNTL